MSHYPATKLSLEKIWYDDLTVAVCESIHSSRSTVTAGGTQIQFENVQSLKCSRRQRSGWIFSFIGVVTNPYPVTPVAGLKHISGNSKFCQGVERKCFSFKAKKSELKYSIYQPNHCSYPLGTHTG